MLAPTAGSAPPPPLATAAAAADRPPLRRDRAEEGAPAGPRAPRRAQWPWPAGGGAAAGAADCWNGPLLPSSTVSGLGAALGVLALRRLWRRGRPRRHEHRRGSRAQEARARSIGLAYKAEMGHGNTSSLLWPKLRKSGDPQEAAAVKCPSVEQAKDLLRKAIVNLKGMATLSELGGLYKNCCWKPALEECRRFVDRHPQHFRTKGTRQGARDVENVTVQLVTKGGPSGMVPNVEGPMGKIDEDDEEILPLVVDFIRKGGGIVRLSSLLQKVYGPAAGLVSQSSVRAFAEVHADFFSTHDSWEGQGTVVKQQEAKAKEIEETLGPGSSTSAGTVEEGVKPLDDPYLKLPTTTLFSSWYVQRRLTKPTLLPIPSLRDASNLAKLFQNNIARNGFLSAAVVQAEIDTACKTRQWTEAKLFSAGEAGRLLAGMSKMLFVVDTTLQVVFATQCIMTLRDVELAILRHPVFRGKDSLQEACIGDLQYHPEVQKRFQFPAGKIPPTIPDVTTWALLSRLKMRGGSSTTAAVQRVLKDLERGKDVQSFEPDTQMPRQQEKKQLVRPVAEALKYAARSLGYEDFREMGVYIQEGTTLHQIVPVCGQRDSDVQSRLSQVAESEAERFASWLALTSPDEHQSFLEGLAGLQSEEAIDRFIKAVEEKKGATTKKRKKPQQHLPREKRVANYVAEIFRHILRTAKKRQFYPGYLKKGQAEEEEDGGAERGGPAPGVGALAEAVRGPDHGGSALPLEVPSRQQPAAAAGASAAPSIEEVDQDEAQGRQIAVVEHLVAIVEGLAAAEGGRDGSALKEHSVPWLLQLLQKAEAEVCRARGVSSFDGLQLRAPFSGVVAEHSAEILKAAGPVGGLAQLQSDIMVFCSKLLIRGYSQEHVRSVARAHFGAALSGLEIDVAAKAAEAQEPAGGGGPLAREFAIAVAQAGLLEDWTASSPPSGREPDELADEAVAAIAQVPHLMDLVLTLDDTWDHKFGFWLGKLTDFLQSTEFTDRVAKRFRVVEVRRGMFITLPLRDSVDWMAALEACDARLAAAIVLARLLDDGNDAPTELLEDTLKRAYKGWINSQPGLAEHFVLTATAALPPGTPKKALDVLAGSYRSLARPHKDLVEAARAAPEFCVASKRLGRHFGVLAWENTSWEEKYNVHRRFGSAMATTASSAEVEGLEEMGSIGSATLNATAEGENAVAEPFIKPLDEGDNKLLCEDICLKRKVALKDVDPKTRQWIKPPEDVGVLALQTTLQGAVKRLAADLYGREAHFLLELVQNADDCQFPAGVIPTFSLTVETHAPQFPLLTTFADSDIEALCVLEHNELGFKAKNVRAISDIAQSTKAAEDKRFIGEKGIGFKSVFRATDTPVVHSNKYHFHFDANGVDGLGCLLPFPLAAPPDFEEETGTRVVLPLRGAQHAADVCTQVMEDMQPMLLLFLRRIEQLKVLDAKAGHRRVMRKVVKSLPGLTSSEEVILKTKDSDVAGTKREESVQRWFVHTMALEESREGVLRASTAEQRALDANTAQTELKLAFRLDLAGDVPQQEAFAWLPLRSYGFRFVVQADWKVPSSREAITGTDAFNQFVREKVPEAFTGAVEAFVRRAVDASQGCITPSIEAIAALDEEVKSAAEGAKVVAKVEAARLASFEALAPMYGALPQEGDGLDFFRRTPGAILEALQEVRCVLVHGPGGRLAFARPRESVLPTLTKLATELSQTTLEEQLPEIEPLLIATKRYREAGGLSPHAAQVLQIAPLNGRIAVDCLEVFAEQHASGGRLSDALISALHLLLLVLGCDEAQQTRQTIERLQQIAILPTSKGELVAAAHSKVYDVDSKFAAALTDIQALDRRLRKICHPRVRQLLDRLGVKKADGKEFFELELMPRLTGRKAKEEELIACTQCAKSFLHSCTADDRLAYAEELKERGFWVIAEKIQVEGSERAIVRIDRKTVLRLARLPEALAKLKSLQWLTQRWYCPSPDYAGMASSGAAAAEQEDEEEGEDWSWEDYWLCVGAWPTVQVKAAVGQSRGGDVAFKDYTSPELRQLLSTVQQHKQVAPVDKIQVATAVVEMLAAHGEFYEGYMSAPAPARKEAQEGDGGAAAAPPPLRSLRTEMAEMLCKEPWIPTVNGELAAPQEGWLAPSVPRTAATEYHQAERNFVFQKVASKLSEAWPSLGIESKPTGAVLLRIIQGLVMTKKPRLSLRQMSIIYLHLGVALRKESTDVGLERFLANEPWLFVPDHPTPNGSFERHFDHAKGGLDAPRAGEFYRTDELVMKDPNNMLDSYFELFSGKSLALMRRGAGVRVVGNYYWGPATRLPLRWGRYSYDKESTALHTFFQRVGIRAEAGWPDYINALKEVDRVVRQQPAESHPEEVVFYVLQQLAREIHAEVERARKETELAGALMAPKDGPAEPAAAGQEEGPPPNMARVNLKYWCSATLHKFLEGTSELVFVPTLGGTWAPLSQVHFVFRGDKVPDWREEALRLVARTKGTAAAEAVGRQGGAGAGAGRGGAGGGEELFEALRLCGLHAQPSTREQVPFTLGPSSTQAERARDLLLRAMELMAEEVQTYGIAAVEAGAGGKGPIGFDRLLDACVEMAPLVNFVSAAVFWRREAVLLSRKAAERAALPDLQLEEGEMAVWSSYAACHRVAVAVTKGSESPVPLTTYAGWRRCEGEGQGEGSREPELVCAMQAMGTKEFSECKWGRSLIPKLLQMAMRAAAATPGATQPDGAFSGNVVGLREVEQVMVQTLRRVVQKVLEVNPRLLEEEEAEEEKEEEEEAPTAVEAEERKFDWQGLLDSLDQADIFRELVQEEQGGPSIAGDVTADDVGRSLAAALDALDPRRRTQPWQRHRFVPEGEELEKGNQQRKERFSQGEVARSLRDGEDTKQPPGDNTEGAGDGSEEREEEESVAPFSLVQANREDVGNQVDPDDELPEFLSIGSMPKMPSLPTAGVEFKVPAKSLDFAVANSRVDSLSLDVKMFSKMEKNYNVDVQDLGAFDVSPYTKEIGRFGEALAVQALQAKGYTVLWLNDGEESGLPFDFLAVPPKATDEMRQRLECLQGADGSLQSTNLKDIPGLLYVEVKTSRWPSEAFHVSFNQIHLMRKLNRSYWLARVVVQGRPHVKLWKGFGEDVRKNKVPILMALPEF